MSDQIRLRGMEIDLLDRRLVSWRLLGTVLAIEVLLTIFTTLVLFRSAWTATMVFGPVRAATGGPGLLRDSAAIRWRSMSTECGRVAPPSTTSERSDQGGR